MNEYGGFEHEYEYDVSLLVVVCEADLYILMLDVSQSVSFTSAKR